MRLLKTALVAGALAVLSVTTIAAYAQDTKIGFIVKQPEEPWFQDEWKFADQAAKEKGFTLVKIGAEDGEKLMSAIDNLGAQGVQASSSAPRTSSSAPASLPRPPPTTSS